MKIFHLPPAVSMRVAGDTHIAYSLLCNWCTRKMAGD